MTAKLVAFGCAALAVTVGVGCGGESDAEMSREAQIYVVAIKAALTLEDPAAGTDDLPIVYVEPLGDRAAEATVQADVTRELREVAELRFADERAEAVLEDEPGMPVRDDGVLVAIGDIPEEGDPVDVEVEIYRSADDFSVRVFTFTVRSSRWTVSSTSVVST